MTHGPILHSYRLGFANNSSSSHSFIYLPDAASADTWDGDGDFGRRNFTLGQEAGKRVYLAAILGASLRGKVPERAIAPLVNAACGTALAGVEEEYAYGGIDAHIDHQSAITLPTTWAGDDVHPEFFADFLAWALRPDVAILGGSDEDDAHPLRPRDGRAYRLPLDDGGGDYVARRDRADGVDYYALFSRASGAKLRMAWGDPLTALAPTRASRPELVDLKLTDACPFERRCGFCYQGSTVGGAAAPYDTVRALCAALAELEVFEVALGGGEPTLWPEFDHLLRYLREDCKIVPNFTTKTLAWARDRDRRQAITAQIGSFAFSAEDLPHAAFALAQRDQHGIDPRQMALQIIPALWSAAQLDGLFALAQERDAAVTLLGYKTTGRGAAFAQARPLRPDGHWLPVYQARRERGERVPRRLMIDTAMAANVDLAGAGVPGFLYHTEEGRFSQYIDAVTMTTAPSSFAPPGESIPLPPAKKQYGYYIDPRLYSGPIREAFASWQS